MTAAYTHLPLPDIAFEKSSLIQGTFTPSDAAVLYSVDSV